MVRATNLLFNLPFDRPESAALQFKAPIIRPLIFMKIVGASKIYSCILKGLLTFLKLKRADATGFDGQI